MKGTQKYCCSIYHLLLYKTCTADVMNHSHKGEKIGKQLTSSMSMMIMFGDETFDGCSVKEQHIIALRRRVKLKADITRIAPV